MEKEVESTAVIYSNNEYRNNKISLLRKSHFYHLSSFFIVAKRRKFSAFFCVLLSWSFHVYSNFYILLFFIWLTFMLLIWTITRVMWHEDDDDLWSVVRGVRNKVLENFKMGIGAFIDFFLILLLQSEIKFWVKYFLWNLRVAEGIEFVILNFF